MKRYSIFLCSLLLGSALNAQNSDSINSINKRNANSIAKGFEYYDGTQLEDKKDKNLILNYLKKIKEENEKQTKVQEKIYKLLKSTLDPDPTIITKKDGTKCVANSSSDCFDYASLIANNPEVKKIPAMKDFLSDPYDMKKVVEYQKWQAELFKHAFNTGNSIQLAAEQFGDKAFPLGLNRSTYNSATGVAEGSLIPEVRRMYLEEIKQKFEITFFLGFNTNLDLMAITGMVDIISSNPKLNYKILFSDNKSKEIFVSTINSLYSKDWVFNNIDMAVDTKNIFKDYGIYTTPSVAMDYKESEEIIRSQTILTGNLANRVFTERVFNYLEFLKVIDYKKLSDSNYWKTKEGEKERDRYFKNKFGVKVGLDVKKEKGVKDGK